MEGSQEVVLQGGPKNDSSLTKENTPTRTSVVMQHRITGAPPTQEQQPQEQQQQEEGRNRPELLFLDSVSYTNRLRSFQPSAKFARHILLCPITCARFGWTCITDANTDATNTDITDIVQCNQCQQMIVFKFHQDLSPISHFKLALLYRKMLATSHQNTCPFANDAKRWLIVNPQQSQFQKQSQQSKQNQHQHDIDATNVPLYLMPMSTEYQVMEDCTETGFLTRDFILREANKLMESIGDHTLDHSLTGIIDADGHADGHGHTDDDTITRIQTVAGLGINTPVDIQTLIQLCQTNLDPINININLTTEIFLLALFGWRAIDSDSIAGNQDSGEQQQRQQQQQQQQPSHLHVHCRLCLNHCQIPLQSGDNGQNRDETSLPNKRPRLDNHPTSHNHSLNNNDTPLFDLINSHRHFCPMSNGFVKETLLDMNTVNIHDPSESSSNLNSGSGSHSNGTLAVDMTKPGWEIFLSSICRGKRADSSNGSVGDGDGGGMQLTLSKQGIDAFDGARVLQKVRASLRSSSLRVRVNVQQKN